MKLHKMTSVNMKFSEFYLYFLLKFYIYFFGFPREIVSGVNRDNK